MAIEKDLIKREIQKLNLLLTGLIEKIGGRNPDDYKSRIEELNAVLNNEFNMSLNNISEMKASELIKQLSEIEASHTDKIAELIYLVLKDSLSVDSEVGCYKNKLAANAIVMIDFLNENSQTFSFKRMNMKNELQQYV
ncbi:hypothetical protein Q4566_00795 [Tamlana sp. 2_MG-2023]|uniref:hypothetical protein n=1 Tax=unclassified Tamlana TaxID=2614803 RepID=UPI0026E36FD6|nr:MULTISPECIES: hypothetical protein [unclassified Tamlana]MDO6758721.1 hypothetical protein [Tamlana sp. 2_MG-2023]MDO6789420.1 hypothetical protein [Tamlana sp. 1_MG-2023]